DVDFRMAWIGALAYTFQIYYDFSGYSDMAIGLGRMFGFEIPENFNYPYLSKSISEFWRRWHISLGTWFKEYVYIPLGGNRKGKVRTYVNLVIVFFLTGLWHGAGFSFIVWGLYHGFFSIAERLASRRNFVTERGDVTAVRTGVNSVGSIMYTFLVVNFGWVLFRASSLRSAIAYLGRMIIPWRYMEARYTFWHYAGMKTVCVGICAVIGAGLLKACVPAGVRERFRGSVVEAVYCGVIFVTSFAAIVANTYNPFIYYQF
ncbi:MAG: MBOAT family protein, partial [Lachnospiraceae bacterium]|nr:MBOAT family protein [Lachnospiraceae bacterium]